MPRQLPRHNFDGSSFSQVSGELGSVAMASPKITNDCSVNDARSDDSFRIKRMLQNNIKGKAQTSKSRKKQKTFSRRRGPSTVADPVNRTLLNLLKENARATYAEIGKRAHLSAPLFMNAFDDWKAPALFRNTR